MMETVIHYGKKSKEPIRSFQEKRADMVLRSLKSYTANNLKQIKQGLLNVSTAAQAGRGQ